MIYFYIDESGSAGKSDWVSVGGYRLSHPGINPFSAPWVAMLQAHELPAIHMREILGRGRAGRSNPWEALKATKGDKWAEWCDRELNCFASMVLKRSQAEEYPITAMGTVVNATYFRSGACKKIAKRADGDAVRFALQRTILQCMKAMAAIDQDRHFGVVLDDNHLESEHFHKWINEIKYGKEWAIGRSLRSLCFVDDIGYPLIQAADMLAYAARDRQQCRTDGTRSALSPTFYLNLTNNQTNEPEVLDAFELDKLEAEEK